MISTESKQITLNALSSQWEFINNLACNNLIDNDLYQQVISKIEKAIEEIEAMDTL